MIIYITYFVIKLIYFLPKFSAAVTPRPTTEIYIKHSSILSFTSNVVKVSAPQLQIYIKNAAKPTVLLDDILASLDNISVKKLIFTP